MSVHDKDEELNVTEDDDFPVDKDDSSKVYSSTFKFERH